MKAKLAVLAGFLVGVLAAVLPAAAARNSSGTYSLPAGNPVVTGTAISSVWANATLADIKQELTNSLDRGGRGGMTAPLPLANGTVALPALTWVTDPDTGVYRIGANNPGMACGGAKVQEWSSTGSILPLGIAVTQSQTNTAAGVFTGNGSAAGLHSTAGATGNGVEGIGSPTSGSGAGLVGTGGLPNGNGETSTGAGTGYGGAFTGGASGAGVHGVGGATSGSGGVFSGTGGQPAVDVGAGHAWFHGTDPTATAAQSNMLTPKNFVKAWAHITTSGGTVTLADGFNISSCALTGGTDIVCTFASAMADTNWLTQTGLQSPAAGGHFASLAEVGNSRTTAHIIFWVADFGTFAAAPSHGDASSTTYELNFAVIGKQ